MAPRTIDAAVVQKNSLRVDELLSKLVSLEEQLASLKLQRKFQSSRPYHHQRSRSRSKSRRCYNPQGRYCFYHFRFGNETEKPDVNSLWIAEQTSRSSLGQKRKIYDNLMENHLSKLKVQNIYDLESETRGQASSERWRYERSLRLSSSFFKEIACRKKSTPCSKLVMRIVYGRDLCNAAMKYGLANEEIARKQYEREYSTEVKICGLFVDKDKPFLCASPDGLVGDDGLIEIKCPYSARFESNLLEFLITKKKKKNSLGFKFSNERGIYLPLNHKFYFQIQGQLFITQRKWCDLYLWCKKDSLTLRIEANEEFWKGIIPKL
ncbi:yqaJ domain-containing protein [Trichonephila clavipes]|nr:yqaJ domain-containing protein [Trichonephila clavipes]